MSLDKSNLRVHSKDRESGMVSDPGSPLLAHDWDRSQFSARLLYN